MHSTVWLECVSTARVDMRRIRHLRDPFDLNDPDNPGPCLSLLTSSDLFLLSQIVTEVIIIKLHLLAYITTVTLLRRISKLTLKIQEIVICSTCITSTFIQAIADFRCQDPLDHDSIDINTSANNGGNSGHSTR
jgi:hypothetical protein